MRFVGGLTHALGVQETLKTGLYIGNGIFSADDLTFNNSLVPSRYPDLFAFGRSGNMDIENVLSAEEWKQIKSNESKALAGLAPLADPDKAIYYAGNMIGAAGFAFTSLSLFQLVIDQCQSHRQPAINGHIQCLKYAVAALLTDMGIAVLGFSAATGDLSISVAVGNATRWIQGVFHPEDEKKKMKIKADGCEPVRALKSDEYFEERYSIGGKVSMKVECQAFCNLVASDLDDLKKIMLQAGDRMVEDRKARAYVDLSHKSDNKRLAYCHVEFNADPWDLCADYTHDKC